MAGKCCIKIKSHLKLNENPEYYIEYEVNSTDKNEIKNGIEKIKEIQNEIIEEAEKNGRIRKTEGQNSDCGDEIIQIKADKSVMVRLYEAMKKSEIVKMSTPVKQFVNLHFREVHDKINFERYYNSTKNRIVRDESSSNSPKLVQYVKKLIESGFKKKLNVLYEFRDFIDLLIKKHGY